MLLSQLGSVKPQPELLQDWIKSAISFLKFFLHCCLGLTPLTPFLGGGLLMFWHCPSVRLLFLSNYWPDFIETLWKHSILRGDLHTFFMSRLDQSTHRYASWSDMHYVYSFVSMLILNYWLDLGETLLEHSIQ